MSDLFSDPKRRLSRAKQHVANLDESIRAFLGKKPYTRAIDVDHATGNQTHKIVLTEDLPDELHGLAVEIAEALRAVLDKCGFVAAQATGNTRLKGTYFPIADTDQAITTDVIGRGRCRDIPDDVVNLFRSFQPHKAGNPPIWAINQLANASKHRVLVPVGMAVGNSFVESFRANGRAVWFGFPPRWDAENNEMKLCVVGPGARPEYKMNLGMRVDLRPVGGMALGPAPAALSTMATEVESVLMATEAEVSRILGA